MVSVDEQYVAACALRDVLGDAPFEQVLEESGLLNTDDDQVGLPLLGEFENPLRRRSGVRDEFGTNGASFEKPALLGIGLVVLDIKAARQRATHAVITRQEPYIPPRPRAPIRRTLGAAYDTANQTLEKRIAVLEEKINRTRRGQALVRPIRLVRMKTSRRSSKRAGAS